MGIVASVMTAFYGGFVASGLGVTYAICASVFAIRNESVSRQSVRDGTIILVVSLIAQLLLLSIPWIYPQNDQVPVTITIAAITALATLLTCWCWAGVTFWRARRAIELSFLMVAMFLSPALASSTVIIGLYAGRFH